MVLSDQAYLFAVPPMLAATFCAYLFWVNTSKTARFHFAILGTMSFSQGSGYLSFARHHIEVAELFADLFNCVLYFMFTNLVIIAINLDAQLRSLKFYAIYLAPLILGVLYVMGFMIDGYKLANYSLMHIDGELAPLGDFYQLLCAGLFLVILLVNSFRLDDWIQKSKNRLMLMSIGPLGLMFGLVIFLSTTRYAISFAIVAPVTILYMASTYHYLTRDTVVNVSHFEGFVTRCRIAWRLLESSFKNDPSDDLTDSLRRLYVEEALRHSDSVRAAAEAMDMKYSTLRARIKRLGIDAEQLLGKDLA